MNRKRKIQTSLFAKILFIGMTTWTMMSCDNSLERLTTNEYPESVFPAMNRKDFFIPIFEVAMPST